MMMAAARRQRGMRSGFTTVRDLLSYAFGTAVLAHEVFLSDHVDWVAALIGMGLLGLPLALGTSDPRPPSGPGR